MKRILAMVLAGILVVSVIPAFAAAEVESATDKGSNRSLEQLLKVKKIRRPRRSPGSSRPR